MVSPERSPAAGPLRDWWAIDGSHRRRMWRGPSKPASQPEAAAALAYARFVRRPLGVLLTLVPRVAAVAGVLLLMALPRWDPGRNDASILGILVMLDLVLQFSHARRLEREAANWSPSEQ
ncbi:MAG TPA: hypothetical protein VLD62_01275 [Acidimicrobiia bacterium]|nr:hypothetical protein [Acidimicrobiia bacterium]